MLVFPRFCCCWKMAASTSPMPSVSIGSVPSHQLTVLPSGPKSNEELAAFRDRIGIDGDVQSVLPSGPNCQTIAGVEGWPPTEEVNFASSGV